MLEKLVILYFYILLAFIILYGYHDFLGHIYFLNSMK